MAIVLEAFPKVSRELVVKSGYIATKYSFSFHDNGEIRQLSATPTDSSTSRTAVLKLEDQGCKWHPEDYELIAECKSIITTPAFFFGPNGLAPNDGIIGVAIMWTAPDASVRGVEQVGELSKKEMGPCEIKGSVRFPPQLLRGTLVMQTVLYLKRRGNVAENEKHLAYFTGTILGVLDETKVIIDGNGSLFPIHMVSNPTEPLWWVQCNWEDPTQDSFTDDNFCIYLNSAHKDFAALNVNEGIKNSPLLMEIICSSLQLLVMKVLNDDVYRDSTIQGNGLNPGSISSVINYFIHLYSWAYDPVNPDVLARDIRRSMMKMML